MKKLSGYTLIEVLISMFFLAFCVLFIISIFPTATTALKQAENIEIASNLAHHCLESVNQTAFASISNYSGSYFYNGYYGGVNYTQNFIYNVTANTVSPNLKDILINITWSEKGKPSQSLKAETIIFNK